MALDQSEVQSVFDEVNNYEKINDYIKILNMEAKRFVSIIESKLSLWFSEYSPVLYKRTKGNAFGVMNIGTVHYTGGTEIRIDVDFDKNWAIREAGKFELQDGTFGKRTQDAYLPILINEGWIVKRGWRASIEHLGIGYGVHFIEAAIEEFKMDNLYGISFDVDLNFQGNQLKFTM